MRLIAIILRAAALIATALAASPTPAAPVNGAALGPALARGEVDPATYDFGALRYAPGQTIQFLTAQSIAQLAVAKAHGKPNWPSVVAAHICPTPAEQLTIAGFDSALIAPDAATWTSEKNAAEAAYANYGAARDAVLAGDASPYPEFAPDQAAIAASAKDARLEVKALYRHQAEDQLWRHALVFGAPKAYAEGVGKAGRVWLNARLTIEGCATDAANAAWLKIALATVPWFDIKTYGKEADAAAWLIAQHADADREVELLALDRMGRLVLTHDSNPANFANLWDKMALADGRPQRYGTQMRCVGRAWTPITPVEEPAKLDERRTWVGLQPELLYQRSGAKVCGG